MTSTRKTQKQDRGLLVIAAFKILKALGLMAVGFGALHFLHRDLATAIEHWVDLLRVDPHSHYLHWILEKLANVDEKKLRELSVGTFFYSALFLCEGRGTSTESAFFVQLGWSPREATNPCQSVTRTSKRCGSRAKNARNGLEPGSLFYSSPTGTRDSCRSRMVIARCSRGFPAGVMTRALSQFGNSYLETRASLILGAGSRLR
jgi:hypothetical protein